MTAERWQQIKKVLGSALELRAEEREEYLAAACAGDPEMLAEVRELIHSHDEAGDLLESPAGGSKLSLSVDAEPESYVGRRLGPYEVVEIIGEGGMGAVYRAVRADQAFRKQVAIKVVKHGMDSDFILRRFRNERQIMANLEHPNIARLLDGGATEDGCPYFVMEYIQGQPIDQFCDSRRLDTESRLRLFQTVCTAVHFAHQRMIVHRDIKPGNILVTAEGEPKLVDFGIAKILNREFSTQSLDPTLTVMRMMTPEYASPEQVRGDKITAASDIYSLGVLLYELLTGHRPYRLKSRAPHEVARAICEDQPAKPSTAVGKRETVTMGNESTTTVLTPEMIGEARGCPPDKLRRILAGDLDNIILMAMRKDPARRYASAAQFGEDIQRHLDGRAVMARGDGLLYRAGKLGRRKSRLLGAVAGGIVLLAVLFAGLGWWQEYHAGLAPTTPPRISRFTSFPGNEQQPVFSPDGSKVAFVWDGEDSRNPDIYVRALSGGDLLRLTTDKAEDLSPAWSPDGQRVAFLRRTRTEAAVYVTPALASAETRVAGVYPTRLETVGRQLDWSPDGQNLAAVDKNSPDEPFSIYLISLANGQKRRLTSPAPGTVGDSNPTFSPDGKSLSFIRAPSSGVTDVFVISLSGGLERRITHDNRWIVSQTWTPDGRDIVFSSNRTGGQNLWKIAAGGRFGSTVPERLTGIGENASDPSFSGAGRQMVFAQFFEDANIWQLTLGPGHAGRELDTLIASTQYDSSPQYSPDGSKVAVRSNRAGNHEIWVSDSDGKNAFQLTNFGGPLTGTPRWSPDGLWVAFDSRPEGQPDIFVIASEGGTPRRLTYELSEDVVPSWSRDGRWVYFASNRNGSWQVWKTPFNGGQKIQVTRGGGFAAFESPDGKYLYYAKGRGLSGLWRVPLEGGEEQPVIPDLKPGYWGYWAVARDGIYFADGPPGSARAGIYFLDVASGRRSLVSPVAKPFAVADSAFALSPDERRILYTQVDQSGSDVIIADYSGR